MASVTITPTFLSGGMVPANIVRRPGSARRATVPVAMAARIGENETLAKEEAANGRRDLVFGAGVVAACTLAGAAIASEPKKGTAEAKKKYAPICVTMPTARICRN